MNGSLIIGAGGHGKVIADAMRCLDMKILGFLDDSFSIIGERIFDIPVLGKIEQWIDFDSDGLVVAIGDNAIRRAIVQRMSQQALPHWLSVIHPKATVSSSVHLGLGAVVMAGAIINADTTIGEHVIINTGATVDHDCVVGDFVHIGPGSHLAGNIHLGEGVLLGIGACVLPGCRIGKDAVIGAGATVVTNIPSGIIAKGTPARWPQAL